MKKTLLTLLLAMLVLTGCTATNPNGSGSGTIPTQTGDHNVTLEEAKEIALTHASLSKDSTQFVVEKLIDAKPTYYLIIMKNDNRTYVYKIETSSGKILVSSMQNSNDDDDIQELIDNALNNVQINDNSDDNPTVVIPEVKPGVDTPAPDQKPSTGEITADQAFAIALKDAGVDRASVTHKEIERDKENNILIYEIEFKVGNDEYDYDIAIADGRIIKKSIDIKNKPSGGAPVSLAKAKEIALAKVPGAKDNHIFIEEDYNNGRVEYEGTIIYDGFEYEFEIDGNTGTVLEWEVESLYD